MNVDHLRRVAIRPLRWQQRRRHGPGPALVRFADGRELELDLADATQAVMATGIFEPAETRIVRRAARRQARMIDVGAHVGWFTTLAARQGCEVVALEAHPANHERLVGNVKRNDSQFVTVHNVAASSVPSTLTIGVQEGGDSGSATVGARATQRCMAIPAAPLDDVLDDDRPIDLLKVDVEGWEPEVLVGATVTLARCQAVLIEINPSALGSNGFSDTDVYGPLEQAGLTSLRVVSRPFLHTIGHGIRGFRNVLATR